MSRVTEENNRSAVRIVKSNQEQEPQEGVIDIDIISTPPDYKENVNSLGEGVMLEGNSAAKETLNKSIDSTSSSAFFSPSHHQLMVDEDSRLRETSRSNMLLSSPMPEHLDLEPGQSEEFPIKQYSQSMSSMLLNLDAINSQENRNINQTGILERSLSINPKERIITEILPESNVIKTSTIKHVLECKGRIHRILAKLMDVYPKELSRIFQPGSYGLTLVLKDRSECIVMAKIKDLTGIRQFFDHFRRDLDQKSLQVHIGALFEYILRTFPLFEDYVIHEEQIPDNTFLLDLCITSAGEDQSYEILNSRLNPHFMIDFCWHLMNSNEDILKEI